VKIIAARLLGAYHVATPMEIGVLQAWRMPQRSALYNVRSTPT
jgi:hypothetical protein